MKSVIALTLAVFCLSMVSAHARFVPTPLTNKNLDFVRSRNFLFDLILLFSSLLARIIKVIIIIYRYIVICGPTIPKSIEMSKSYVEKLFYFLITFCCSFQILSISVAKVARYTLETLLRLTNSLASLFLQYYMEKKLID